MGDRQAMRVDKRNEAKWEGCSKGIGSCIEGKLYDGNIALDTGEDFNFDFLNFCIDSHWLQEVSRVFKERDLYDVLLYNYLIDAKKFYIASPLYMTLFVCTCQSGMTYPSSYCIIATN